MIKIALCDDEKKQQEIIGSLLFEYFKEGVNLNTYTEGQKLLDYIQWEGKEIYDLYILDVIMPQQSGIELGRKLRSMGVIAPIIYLTTSRDYAVESYNVRAFHYLVKPVDKEKLFSVLSQAEKLILQTKANAVTVHTADGTMIVKAADILYAELYARSVRYYLTDGSVIDSQKLRISFQKAVSSLLELRNFMMLGSSFVVNLHHVKKVGKKDLLLINGKTLAVPKGTKNDLLNRWMDYWLEEKNMH